MGDISQQYSPNAVRAYVLTKTINLLWKGNDKALRDVYIRPGDHIKIIDGQHYYVDRQRAQHRTFKPFSPPPPGGHEQLMALLEEVPAVPSGGPATETTPDAPQLLRPNTAPP